MSKCRESSPPANQCIAMPEVTTGANRIGVVDNIVCGSPCAKATIVLNITVTPCGAEDGSPDNNVSIADSSNPKEDENTYSTLKEPVREPSRVSSQSGPSASVSRRSSSKGSLEDNGGDGENRKSSRSKRSTQRSTINRSTTSDQRSTKGSNLLQLPGRQTVSSVTPKEPEKRESHGSSTGSSAPASSARARESSEAAGPIGGSKASTSGQEEASKISTCTSKSLVGQETPRTSEQCSSVCRETDQRHSSRPSADSSYMLKLPGPGDMPSRHSSNPRDTRSGRPTVQDSYVLSIPNDSFRNSRAPTESYCENCSCPKCRRTYQPSVESYIFKLPPKQSETSLSQCPTKESICSNRPLSESFFRGSPPKSSYPSSRRSTQGCDLEEEPPVEVCLREPSGCLVSQNGYTGSSNRVCVTESPQTCPAGSVKGTRPSRCPACLRPFSITGKSSDCSCSSRRSTGEEEPKESLRCSKVPQSLCSATRGMSQEVDVNSMSKASTCSPRPSKSRGNDDIIVRTTSNLVKSFHLESTSLVTKTPGESKAQRRRSGQPSFDSCSSGSSSKCEAKKESVCPSRRSSELSVKPPRPSTRFTVGSCSRSSTFKQQPTCPTNEDSRCSSRRASTQEDVRTRDSSNSECLIRPEILESACPPITPRDLLEPEMQEQVERLSELRSSLGSKSIWVKGVGKAYEKLSSALEGVSDTNGAESQPNLYCPVLAIPSRYSQIYDSGGETPRQRSFKITPAAKRDIKMLKGFMEAFFEKLSRALIRLSCYDFGFCDDLLDLIEHVKARIDQLIQHLRYGAYENELEMISKRLEWMLEELHINPPFVVLRLVEFGYNIFELGNLMGEELLPESFPEIVHRVQVRLYQFEEGRVIRQIYFVPTCMDSVIGTYFKSRRLKRLENFCFCSVVLLPPEDPRSLHCPANYRTIEVNFDQKKGRYIGFQQLLCQCTPVKNMPPRLIASVFRRTNGTEFEIPLKDLHRMEMSEPRISMRKIRSDMSLGTGLASAPRIEL